MRPALGRRFRRSRRRAAPLGRHHPLRPDRPAARARFSLGPDPARARARHASRLRRGAAARCPPRPSRPLSGCPMTEPILTPEGLDRMTSAMTGLEAVTDRFGRTLTDAFSRGILAGRSFEEVLRGVGQRFVDIALQAAMKPAESLIGSLL